MIIRLQDTSKHWCSYAHPGAVRQMFPLKPDGTPDMTKTVPVKHNGCIGPACSCWVWTYPDTKDHLDPADNKILIEIVDYRGFCGRSGDRHDRQEYDFHENINGKKKAGNLSHLS